MDHSPVRRHQLDALADPTRRAILELLRERPLTAGEIAARFSQQRPAISKHLTLLRSTGWLAESRDRQRRIYSLRNDAVVVVVDWARRLGEATQVTDSHAAKAAVFQGVLPSGKSDQAGNEAEISNLKSQMIEAGRHPVKKNDPVENYESGPTNRPARSSFELIFD